MNKYLKNFLIRGLIFGGFGPIIVGIVFVCIERTGTDLALTGADVLLGIISTYLIAFVQAGASVFNQIEHWSIAKSLLCHFSSLFAVYSLSYILNSWIPFEPVALLIFFAVFAVIYFAVWITVYFSVRAYTKRMNEKIGQK